MSWGMQLLLKLLGYVLFWFVVGCYLLPAICFLVELAKFRREDPRFEGDKLIYRS